ncbi:SMI1/KNR4 family protein [Roseateles sp. BYS78W]|uniref:SMI1/KNR4 family protein n=1 Tax=Pelomonas candidula TaxID=3299025 RepID=A0ABW7H9P4_9BURK
MTATLKSLILRARAEHDCSPGASPDEIASAESRLGHHFPEELRELLSECNGIRFWTTGNFPCRLLPVGEIRPVHLLLETEEGPPGTVALVESQGDFVAMGLDREGPGYAQLIDCSHETFPHELLRVCGSIPDFLALVLDSQDDEWIWPAARVSGVDFAE